MCLSQQLIADLRDIVDSDKFTIIDLGMHKTVRAVKGSLWSTPRGEPVHNITTTKKHPTLFDFEFTPTSIGRYRVDFDSPQSPYFINVYEPSSAVIMPRRPENFIVGNENIIEGSIVKIVILKISL